jgi:NDP-sugar pyrophosphorylase family protein
MKQVPSATPQNEPFARAMVLAAGFGTRLRPLTQEVPKPLVEVCGVPLIVHTLSHLKKAGVREVMINTHHLPGAIPKALGDEVLGMRLHYSEEAVILGTGGGLANVASFFREGGAPFFLLNADALIDVDLAALKDAHLAHNPLATLVLKRVEDPNRFGALGTDADGVIRTFAGRVAYAGPPLLQRMFCGIHAIHPDLLEYLPKEGESCINKEGYPVAMARGRTLKAVDHPGYFCDVGTPERLLEANLTALTNSIPFENLDFRSALGPLRNSDDESESGWQRQWISTEAHVDPGATLQGPVLIASGARIHAGAVVGPGTVVGSGAEVGEKARVAASVLQSESRVPAHEVHFGRVFGKSSVLEPDWQKVVAENGALERLQKAG